MAARVVFRCAARRVDGGRYFLVSYETESCAVQSDLLRDHLDRQAGPAAMPYRFGPGLAGQGLN